MPSSFHVYSMVHRNCYHSIFGCLWCVILALWHKNESESERRRAGSCHRWEPKTVLAQTAEITKCHVIFIVFFKFWIEIAGGDGINQFLLKIWAFWCIICLCSCWEQKGHQKILKGSHGRCMTSSSDSPILITSLKWMICLIFPTKVRTIQHCGLQKKINSKTLLLKTVFLKLD